MSLLTVKEWEAELDRAYDHAFRKTATGRAESLKRANWPWDEDGTDRQMYEKALAIERECARRAGWFRRFVRQMLGARVWK